MQRDARLAMARYRRRCELWANARQACHDDGTFRTNIGPIERAIARILAEEVPA